MSRFNNIDSKLEVLSKKLNAVITKDRPDNPEPLRTFEERRIDWTQNDIRKAIIIQPSFELTGVNSNRWSFINIAWIEKIKSGFKPKWVKILVEKQEFSIIEEGIDELLINSVENLNRITEIDLK